MKKSVIGLAIVLMCLAGCKRRAVEIHHIIADPNFSQLQYDTICMRLDSLEDSDAVYHIAHNKLATRMRAIDKYRELSYDPNEPKAQGVRICQHNQISTCCVYGCDGYGCTTCMSCGKTLVAANTWEVK